MHSDGRLASVSRSCLLLCLRCSNLAAGEGWAPEVLKLVFSSQDEGQLGHVYIDPRMRWTTWHTCMTALKYTKIVIPLQIRRMPVK